MARAAAAAILLGLATLLCSPTLARDVRSEDGPAVGVALGADGGGFFGGFAAYYVAWPNLRLGVMPHAGIGLAAYREANPALSVGVAGSFGRSHRLVVDFSLTGVGAQDLTLYGERLDAKTVYGVGLLVGWEWLSKSGFFVRANLGPAYAFLPPLYPRSEAWTVTFNLLSIGAKLW